MVPTLDPAGRDVLIATDFMSAFDARFSLQFLTFAGPMEPPPRLSADHAFQLRSNPS